MESKMKAKIQKSLDYNKLLADQAKGKLLKKHLTFPLYAGIKWDGNYVVVRKYPDRIEYITSGGHYYTNDPVETIFDNESVPCMTYLAERIGTTGELGDRVNCSLRGPRGKQVAVGHKYKVHDCMTNIEYDSGSTIDPYHVRRNMVRAIFEDHWANDMPVHTREELENYLDAVVKRHYEGLMLKQPEWYWKDTKSRTLDCAKYKKRPTADLLCIDVTEGEGKYVGMIGSLVLKDKSGRIVSVGSGLTDDDRDRDPNSFIGRVVEIEYEQVLDTYIQPTFITMRLDKDKEDID